MHLVRCNFYNCTTGLKYGSRSSTLTLDYCKFKANNKHIEISRCDLIHLNHCHFNEFYPAASGDVAIEVGTGRLHVYGSSFTPEYQSPPNREHVDRYLRHVLHTHPRVRRRHIGLVAHGVRAGGGRTEDLASSTMTRHPQFPSHRGSRSPGSSSATPRSTQARETTAAQHVLSGSGRLRITWRSPDAIGPWAHRSTGRRASRTRCRTRRPLSCTSRRCPGYSADLPGRGELLRGENAPLDTCRIRGARAQREHHQWSPTGNQHDPSQLVGSYRRTRSSDNLPPMQDSVTGHLGDTGLITGCWILMVGRVTGDDQFDIRLNTTLGSPVEFAWSVDLAGTQLISP